MQSPRRVGGHVCMGGEEAGSAVDGRTKEAGGRWMDEALRRGRDAMRCANAESPSHGLQ